MKRQAGNRAFTLIEMLVVVVIILILSGILLKVATLVSSKTGISRCEYQLQQIQNVLTEFHAEYGHYPPATTMGYEYECAPLQTDWFRDTFLPVHDNPHDPGQFFGDKERPEGELGHADNEGWYLGYEYGLFSYLYKRDRGAYTGPGRFNGMDYQQHWYDQDTPRDEIAKERWHHFIEGFGEGHYKPEHPSPPNIGSQAPYRNERWTIFDPWRSEYKYESYPPYQRYKLWSMGPDRTDGTGDDVHARTQ